MRDLDKLTIDELHGILIAYRMRTEKEKLPKQEATFKVSKKMKNKELEPSYSSSDELNAKEAPFLRKLKKGFSKYKGNLSFKYFDYGKVGHFAAKCPYMENESRDDKEKRIIKKGSKHEQYKKSYKQGKNVKKFFKHKKKPLIQIG